MSDEYVVYEHWRPDLNVCFYVGKGKPRRSRRFQRNSRYDRIVGKLARLGLRVEVRIIHAGISNERASALEIELIAAHRAAGTDIANFTDGGDGSSGWVHTESALAKIRKKATGRRASEETKAKMSAARKGSKRSAETKEKMRQAALKVQSAARKAECSTQKGRLRMLHMSRSAAKDPEVRAKRSANAKALWANPEYRAKVMAARCVPKPVVKGFS
jgi:hypothetical protein